VVVAVVELGVERGGGTWWSGSGGASAVWGFQDRYIDIYMLYAINCPVSRHLTRCEVEPYSDSNIHATVDDGRKGGKEGKEGRKEGREGG
jgi:hypothetical protein